MMDSEGEAECRVLPGGASSKEDGCFANNGKGSSKMNVNLDGKLCEDEDLMEMVTCLACDGTESLLMCEEDGCGFAIHEKCLPCLAYFDASGSFYCPRCSYERAEEECLKAKKCASLAKQALLKFISGNNPQPEAEGADRKWPSPSTSVREVDHLAEAGDLRKKGDSGMCKRTDLPDSSLKEYCANEDNCGRTMDHLVHPSTSLESDEAQNLANEKMRTESNKTLNQVMEGHEFATCTKHVPTSYNHEKDNLHTSGVRESEKRHYTHQNLDVEDYVGRVPEADNCEANEGGEAQPQGLRKTECPARPGSIGKRNDTGPVDDIFNISTATHRKRHADRDKIRGENKGRDHLYIEESDLSDSDVGTTRIKKPNAKRHQKEMRAKHVQSSNNPDIQNVNADGSVKGSQARELAPSSLKNKSDTDNQGKSGISPYTRRRIQWTAEEVEILKVGMQKFSVPNKNIPWGRILEYGSQVFHRSRAAIDLKDKWRSLTKLSKNY